MTGRLWLGLDLGTTGVRCVVFDDDLAVQASSYLEAPPDTSPGGVVEQDAERWVEAALGVLRGAVEQVEAASVAGLSVSSQGITVVPVDDGFRPLRPSISWLDQRGQESLPTLRENWQALTGRPAPEVEIAARTGKVWDGGYTLPKVLWLQRHEPGVMQRCRALLLPMDYLLLRLTGRLATDHTMAAGTMLYRNQTRAWDPELVRAGGLAESMLPPIRDAGSVLGPLLPSIAEPLGLPRTVMVSVGGQDQKCAALAAGLATDIATLSLGTAGALTIPQPVPDCWPGIPVFPFFDGGWVREGSIPTAGEAWRWLTRVLLRGNAELEALASVAGGAAFFFPQLSRTGPDNAGRWGVPPAGVFWGLTLDAGPGDLARAVLEGVTFELALLWRSMGTPGVTVLRVFGGGAANQWWCQLIADSLDVTVEALATHEAAAAGAAMLAGAPGRLTPARAYHPDPSGAARAAARLGRYRAIRELIYD